MTITTSTIMDAIESLSSCFILRLIYFLLHFHLLLTYSLKDCNIDYQKSLLVDVSLKCADRNLVTVPDDLPKDAVSVNLYDNLVQKINKEDFRGMTKLKHLSLEFNHISHVEEGSFIDLVLLETLSMGNNELTNLTRNMFQGLFNLTVLYLFSNKIQFIHPSAFQFLTSLQTLDLSNNNLLQVSDIQPILQLPRIQTLNLGENLFYFFETKDLLLNYSSLKELTISGYNFKKFSITTPIFPHLEMIDIPFSRKSSNLKWDIPDKNLLRSITRLYVNEPVFSFQEIQNVLQSLDSLSHLQLNNVDRWFRRGLLSTICKIPTLRKLDLFYNHLDKLTHQLAPCSQLRELDLHEIHITELSKGSIQSMKNLHSLNVSVNQLTRVPHDIRSLASLQILNMDYNRISELSCEDFVNTTNLTTLSLNSNRISNLETCVFENLTYLTLLDLGNNLLLTFGDVFKIALCKLEVLDLSQNSISFLDTGGFQGLQSLRQLNVASKSIGRVKRRAFKGLNNLETLVLSLPLEYEPNFRDSQQLEKLTIYLDTDGGFKIPYANNKKPNQIIHLKSLKNLTVICSGYHYGIPFDVPIDMLQTMRHLESFKAVNVYNNAPQVGTFQFNPKLKSLTLTGTDLSDLDPELFKTIPNLQTLDLSESINLKSLDFLLQANLTALRYLKLTDNEINVINETVFTYLPSLTYLDLSNNPFTCVCSNAGFIQWVKNSKQTQVVNAHRYKCSFPVDKQGTLLLDFDIQPCWNDGSFFYFLSSTCLVVLTLLTSFIYHFLKWQLVYTYHLLLAFLYDSRRKKGDPHQFDAFVSYNVHDEDWVHREMLPVLEGEQGWRLCLHHRDFQPGKPIIENITDAIYGSRKTICVISRHYLQSEWCSREIQMASFRLFDEQKDVLVLLFLEEIPPHHLSPYYRMRKLVKKRTYLSWPQAAQHPGVFWKNVQRALQSGDAPTEDTDLLTGQTGC